MPNNQPKLNAVIARAEDGSAITVRQRILEWVRRGAPYDTSAAAAGISKSTLNWWLREAARATERSLINPKARLTPWERDLIVFQRQVDEANAEAEMRLRKNMGDLAEGGLSRTTIVVKQALVDGRMTEVERTQRAERTLPSFAANRWLLEERFAKRPSGGDRLEDGELTDDEALTHLGDAMEVFLASREADVHPDVSVNGNGSSSH